MTREGEGIIKTRYLDWWCWYRFRFCSGFCRSNSGYSCWFRFDGNVGHEKGFSGAGESC